MCKLRNGKYTEHDWFPIRKWDDETTKINFTFLQETVLLWGCIYNIYKWQGFQHHSIWVTHTLEPKSHRGGVRIPLGSTGATLVKRGLLPNPQSPPAPWKDTKPADSFVFHISWCMTITVRVTSDSLHWDFPASLYRIKLCRNKNEIKWNKDGRTHTEEQSWIKKTVILKSKASISCFTKTLCVFLQEKGDVTLPEPKKRPNTVKLQEAELLHNVN